MSDNNNNKNPERPNPFGSYPYPITNASRTGNNNQPPPLTEKMINTYKTLLNAKIGFLFFKEKIALERAKDAESIAIIDKFTNDLRDKYIKNWDENVMKEEKFRNENGRFDPKIVDAVITASALALNIVIPKGGRRRRRKKRTKKRRKSRRKSKGRKRRKSRRRKRR